MCSPLLPAEDTFQPSPRILRPGTEAGRYRLLGPGVPAEPGQFHKFFGECALLFRLTPRIRLLRFFQEFKKK